METDLDGDQSSDDEFLTKSLAHIQIKPIKKTYGLKKMIPLMVNDIHFRAEPDTGAGVNVMDDKQYRALQQRSTSKIDLQKSSKSTYTTKRIVDKMGF